jgi:hypothetical protein
VTCSSKFVTIPSLEELKLSESSPRLADRRAFVQLASQPSATPPRKYIPIPDVPGTPEGDFNIRVNNSLVEWESSRKLCRQTFSNAFFEKHGVRPIGPALEQRFESLFPEWKRVFVRTADGTLLDGLDLETEVGLRRWESEYYENRRIYAKTLASDLDDKELDEKFRKANPQWEPRYKQVASPKRTTPSKEAQGDKPSSSPEVINTPSSLPEAITPPSSPEAIRPSSLPGAIGPFSSAGIYHGLARVDDVIRRNDEYIVRRFNEFTTGLTVVPYLDDLVVFGSSPSSGVGGELRGDPDEVK